ncbi:hypothetical protein [Tissierella pigra]|uniref:Uncharacterized protein n=1 Tax=Tissierella pigra TaxID=2607614 RepID=A0A6N7XIL1_9FIRM|nr:hypothetical protein [Tissierella pigra]MSU01911.1 hypothetical protein [Tissierella pigra]
MSAICMEFTKTYSGINLDFQRKDAKGYDYTMLLIYLNELKKGYKVKRINKTTKKGTSVVYSLIKSKEELAEYENLIKCKVQEFNKKWNCDLEVMKEE